MGAWKSNEVVEAEFDDTGTHRLKLVCSWAEELPRCLYIMLNPSVADLENCDPTLDKCIKIAKHNGYGSIAVVNLFSYRSPKPEDLLAATNRNHPTNLEIVKAAIEEADMIVAAWGEKGVWFNGCYPVLKYVEEAGKALYCLGENKYGWPRHPLFMKSESVFRSTGIEKGLRWGIETVFEL